MQKVLLMMVGLPRSGKTTVAKSQQETHRKQGRIVPIVCPDDIRLAIHGKRFDRDFENLVWYTASTMVKTMFLQHDLVMLDATNITVASRLKWKDSRWQRHFLGLDQVPKDICIERAKESDQEDLIPVIEKMAGFTQLLLAESTAG